jgi:hypothetical protein
MTVFFIRGHQLRLDRFSIGGALLLTVAAHALQAGVSKTATAVIEIAKRMGCDEPSPLFFLEMGSGEDAPHSIHKRVPCN